MNGDLEQASIQRILVLLDTSANSWAALELAAEVAARRGAELLGLFIEDIDLVRSASLPFAQELSLTSATTRPLDPSYVEQRLKRQAIQIRQALDRAAQRRSVHWSFQVRRGRVTSEVLAYTSSTDLLVLGKQGQSTLRTSRLGSTARSMVVQAPCSVLISEAHAHPVAARLAVLVEDRETGLRALTTAAFLAQEENQVVTVLLPRQQPELQTLAQELLGRWGLQPHLVELPRLDGAAIATTLKQGVDWTLVLSRASSIMAESADRKILDSLDFPLVVVP